VEEILQCWSEFYSAGWSGEIQEDTRFKGWYVEGSWFLAGETANYWDGKFGRLAIKGARGAWGVALRLSSPNLSDKDVQRGVPRIISAWASTGTQELTGASWETSSRSGQRGRRENRIRGLSSSTVSISSNPADQVQIKYRI